MNLRTDHAQAANHIRTTVAHVGRTGHIIEMDPTAFFTGDNALSTKDYTILLFVLQLTQSTLNRLFGEVYRGFHSPAIKHLICVMVVVMVVAMTFLTIGMIMVMMMMMFMIVAMAILTIMVMVMVVILMVMVRRFLAVVIMLFMMIMMVATAHRTGFLR